MKAPPSHIFIEANEHDHVVDNFWDSGRKKEEVKKKQADSINNSNSNQSHNTNVPDLLKWISDVTIKRRKFRRRYRCSHLLAEAVLSNTLRNARQELAMKQEEKRKKAHEFSYKLSIKFSKVEEESQSQVEDCNNNDQEQPNYNYTNQENKTNQLKVNESSSMETGRESEAQEDEQVKACMSSLDNFFSELKSIKV